MGRIEGIRLLRGLFFLFSHFKWCITSSTFFPSKIIWILCVLCKGTTKSLEHNIFHCPFSYFIWFRCLASWMILFGDLWEPHCYSHLTSICYVGLVKKAVGAVGVIHDRTRVIDDSLEECRAAISHTKESKASVSISATLLPDRVLDLFKRMIDEV